MSDPELKKRIIQFLKDSYPKDFNIQEVADELGIHRNTMSTYLKVLHAEKKITLSRKIGKMNMYVFEKE